MIKQMETKNEMKSPMNMVYTFQLKSSVVDKIRNAKTLETILEAYNLCGLDGGDGEISVSRVIKAGEVEDLNLTRSGKRTIPNILYLPEATGKGRLVEEAVDLDKFGGKNIYMNFKCLQWERAYSDGEHTCGELMAHSIACTVERMFAHNPNAMDKEKETILLVGRPSSIGWQARETEYAALLGSLLPRYLGEEAAGKIHILVMSESSAAMAGAVKLSPEQWQSGATIILDLGSSTFDMTIVTPEGIAYEDSYSFGGNKVDQLLEQYGNYQFSQTYSGRPVPERYGRVSQMRFMKELCYGPNGSHLQLNINGTTFKYPVDKQFFYYEINRETVRKAISRDDEIDALLCSAQYHGAIQNETPFTGSWLEVCRSVMADFSSKSQYFCNNQNHVRLILTGGVSNMPEVKEIAEQTFGTEPRVAKNPSHTVSRGLGMILGNEIIKLQLVEELKGQVSEVLADAQSLREIGAQTAADAYFKYIWQNLSDWAGGWERQSVNDFIALEAAEHNPHDAIVRNCGKMILEKWFAQDGINGKIEVLLRKQFQQMFPDFRQKFDSRIETPDFHDIELELPVINLFYFFSTDDLAKDGFNVDEELTCKRDEAGRAHVLEVFQSHWGDLRDGILSINGVDVVGGASGERPVVQWFREQFDCIENDIRSRVLEALYPTIEKFVERLTYYLAVK